MSRPSSFREEYIEQAKKLALLGATDKDLANFFNVVESTINKWKLDYPKFSESLKEGKDELDARVVQSLYRRATGYSHKEDKIFNNGGEPLIVPTIKEYAPDTTACIFWLKNRQKEHWRDAQAHEHTGKDGGPIETNDVSDLEAARKIAYLLNSGAEELDTCH